MSLIPKKIYQSWKTKELSGKMLQVVKQVKILNPEYDYYLYDDDDCRKFLLDNFGVNYANAFDVLIPGAFKCDFWRYAMLYVNGGVYLDIDMVPLVPFREMLDDDDEFVSIVGMEQWFHQLKPLPGIFQSFIACKPKHPILLYTLEMTYYNIVSRRIGESLTITGPTVMAIAFNLFMKNVQTHSVIEAKKYGNGIKIYDKDYNYTYGFDRKPIFQNKYDGYVRGIGDYTTVLSYYHDDPRKGYEILCLFFQIFGIIFLVVLIWLFLRRKIKN